MPSIPDNEIDVAEVTLKAHMVAAGSNLVPIANVLHFKRDSVAPALAKAPLAAIIITDLVDVMVLGQSSRFVMESVDIRWMNDALDSPVATVDASVGAIATDSLPADQCVYMLKRTSLRGRQYRGGVFFAGIPEAHTTGDIVNVTGMPFWEDVRDALMLGFTDSNGNVWRLQVLSKAPPSQLTANPTTVRVNEVTELKINSRVTDLDRRKAASVYA